MVRNIRTIELFRLSPLENPKGAFLFIRMEYDVKRQKFFLLGFMIALIGFSGTACLKKTVFFPKSRSFEFSYIFTVPERPEAKNVWVWVPWPKEDIHQQMKDWRIAPDIPFERGREEKYGNVYLKFDFSDRARRNKPVTVTFRVLRRIQEGPILENLAEEKRKLYLSPERLVPVGGKPKQEAEQVAAEVPGDRERLKKLYEHIVKTVRYDKSGKGWGRGDALYACNVRAGNCTDFHSLWIAEARALGLPARFLIGFPIPEGSREGKIAGYHCWAEGYIAGEGWLPVDASEAHKHPGRRSFYFGRLDPNRIHFTTGRDLVLPGMKGEPLNYWVYPYAEAEGKPISLDAEIWFSERGI